jgi:hypothetical protein
MRRRDMLMWREISRLRAKLQHKDLLLQIANDTIRTMKATSDRDWAMILRLRAESWRRS